MSETKESAQKKRKGKWLAALLLLLLLLFLVIFGVRFLPHSLFQKKGAGGFGSGGGVGHDTQLAPASRDSTKIAAPEGDSVLAAAGVADTILLPAKRPRLRNRGGAEGKEKISGADSLARRDSLARVDSLMRADSLTLADSLERKRVTDSLAFLDSAGLVVSGFGSNPCLSDTIPPWVYPDPSGGLHQSVVYVRLVVDKAATLHWRLDQQSEWQLWDGTPIEISRKTNLWYKGVDLCGNQFGPKQKVYEIGRKDGDKGACPQDMELIAIGETRFCIDRFEWPNRFKKLPTTFVSLYQATDSCFSVGKRLCTADEWSLACAGPHSWDYPYGQKYESRGCVTQDSSRIPSGTRPECRGYFDVYDMAGNVLEWTSTRAVENRDFSYVMGGFWESGVRSGCFSKRYSYFPQNRHNPVGFRCCRDSDPPR